MDKKTVKCNMCGCTINIENDDERYCSHCGTPLFNECTNYECQHILASEAAYCKYCGSKSTFLNLGIVQSKKPIAPTYWTNGNDDDELPF